MIKDAIILVGISCRTTNATEASAEAKIPSMFGRYFAEEIFSQLPNRANPGILYSCYTDYSSDHTGEYTYFLGEQVTSADDNLPEGLNVLAIPAQSYHVASNAGPMPQTCVKAWQEIWADSALNAQRTYLVDFEKYDMAKMSPDHTEFEIYIGIRAINRASL